MTYAQIATAKSKHESAAKMIRYAGFSAKCIRNEDCEQPYEVRVDANKETAGELQVMMEKMFSYPVNVVTNEN